MKRILGVTACIMMLYATYTYLSLDKKNSSCIEHTDGWVMDTLYHPTDPNRFNVSLHYYQEIQYKIDTVEVIEEDGIRWYTLDTIQYESIDTTIINYPWGREEVYYFKYKENE